jgi:glycosyltransferase involved in cell wall biosynthesis
MPSLVMVIPGELDTRTGGYGYDRRIIEGLRRRGWSTVVGQLAETFPFPSTEAREHAAQMLAALPDDSLVMVDGLALGALPDEARQEARRLRLVGLVHHPLAEETGLEPSVAAALGASERRALAAVRHVIVTSRGTAAALSGYGVSSERITVVEPGTDRGPIARSYRSTDAGNGQPIINLLCVASLTPRKDHETLFEALATLVDRRWRLRCAGAERDAPTVRRLRAHLAESGLAHRVALLGDLNETEVAEEYDRADVFVLATRYEGYGMAVAEALARGLPVVSTPTGAIPDLVNRHAGILVPPGDARALAAALASVIDDEALRLRLAGGARDVRARLPTWDDAADRMSAVLSRIGELHRLLP